MKAQSRFGFAIATVLLIMAAFIALPLMAQDSTADEPVIVVGAVDFDESGNILVGGYVVDPTSAGLPSLLVEGDVVIIIGNVSEDGTLVATSIELFDGELPEVTPEPEITPEATESPEATPEATESPEATPEATESPEATPEATEQPNDCAQQGHPVASQLAEEFGVSVETVMALHCDGNGFGEIARAYLLAEQTGATAEDYLLEHQSGTGWGQIVRESGVHPSSLAPGRVIGRGHRDDMGILTPTPESTDMPESTATPDAGEDTSSTGQFGNGNGNANGNANGNGNGNANGNANGNGGSDEPSAPVAQQNGNGGNGDGNANGNANGNGGGNGNANGNGGGNANGNGNGNGNGRSNG
jgi:hypothetical protein